MNLQLFTAPATASEVRTMSTREVSELTGKQHKDVLSDTRKMLEELGLTLADFSADLPDAYGRLQPVFLLPKRESLILVSGYSTELRARIIDRWQELEAEKAAAKAAPATMHPDPAARAVVLAGVIADTLRLHGSARIGIVRSAMQLTAPELLAMLPSYAIDAPAGADVSGSSEPTFSATHLLKEHGVKISAVAFNKMLRECGMLSHENRRASNGRLKAFWSVTDKGLPFGKNVVSDKNPRETQPHWYASKFAQLLAAAGVMQ